MRVLKETHSCVPIYELNNGKNVELTKIKYKNTAYLIYFKKKFFYRLLLSSFCNLNMSVFLCFCENF